MFCTASQSCVVKTPSFFKVFYTFQFSFEIAENIVSAYMCNTTQYVQFGEEGTISCTFPEYFYGVFWYGVKTVTSSDRAVISYQDGKKAGFGYSSGEYDVFPNGSLIIKQASLEHNRYFGVTVLVEREQEPVFENVRVIVFGKCIDLFYFQKRMSRIPSNLVNRYMCISSHSNFKVI